MNGWMDGFKIDLKTHWGFLLLYSDLLGYLSPLWALQGSGLPLGAHPINTHTDTHTYQGKLWAEPEAESQDSGQDSMPG